MPIYDLRCGQGHRFAVSQSFTAPLPDCPYCGAATTKVPSRVAVTGLASAPPPPERMPQTWRGTYGANREYVAELRRTADARRRLEEKYPELAGDRRPILAHEGRFERAPLRAGDPLPGAAPSHAHAHGHGHGQGHGRGRATAERSRPSEVAP